MDSILQVNNLTKNYLVKVGHFLARRQAEIRAVDDVSFDVKRGEVFGLVGESGCGKTTAGRLIARLLPADAGKVVFEGEDVFSLSGKALRALRRKIQFIFQDPLSSLNPRMSIGEIVSEPMEIHKIFPQKQLKDAVISCLEEVGLNSGFLGRFPHQLSGGQRQRVLIARALSLSPTFVVADEPVSALDVSVQAQVLNLLEEIRSRRGFSSLFISHDLAVVRNLCQRIAVMYMGNIVETGAVEDIFKNPLHPYTRGLLESAPDLGRKSAGRIIPGDIPDPLDPPPGCKFHPRCPEATANCRITTPRLEGKKPGRMVSCILA
jgi:oligopeptide transport system ATP-binding protein